MKFVQTPSFKLAVYAKGDVNAKKLALVLPGRLDTKDYVHMTSHVDFLAGHGYYALSFDPPGSWESPGDIKDYTTSNYLKVINQLIEHFGNKPTLLLGHSRGGAIAMLTAPASPHVKAVVLINATYGDPTGPLPDEIKNGVYISSRSLPPGDTKDGPQKAVSLPLSYFSDGQQYHPAAALKKFRGPKLLICASQDAFVDPQEVKKVYDSLPQPKILLELNTEHDYRYHADMIEQVNSTVGEFLKTSVK